MQITMEALELALAPIEEVGKGELEFEVNGTTVTLRRMSPEEEAEVQRYAAEALVSGEEAAKNAASYIERFKLATLSCALVQLGPMDLREVKYVETGEKLETGVAIKVPRVEAMRKLLLKWSSTVRIAMFRKYSNLLTQIETKAEKSFTFDPDDLDTEIERVEERLERLKDLRKQNQEDLESEVSKVVKKVANEDERKQRVKDGDEPEDGPIEEVAAEAPEPAPTPPKAAEPSTTSMSPPPDPQVAPVRRSAIPQTVRPAAQPVTLTPAPVAQPIQRPRPQQESDFAAGMDAPDSFVDFGDSGSMEEAIHAENLRMLRQRQQAAQGRAAPDSPSVLGAVHARRAPHLVARNVPLNDDDVSDELLHTGRSIDGAEVFARQSEEVGFRMQVPPEPKTVLSPGANPNFRKPKTP